MAIWQTDVIDCMAINNGNELVLVMTDHLQFIEQYDYKHLIQIQKKLNAYIAFIENEQYKEHHPNTNFERFVIEMHFIFEPSKTAKDFFAHVRQAIEPLTPRVELVVEVSSEDERKKYDVNCTELDYEFELYDSEQ